MANTLKLHPNGAVGFIDWLDGLRDIINGALSEIPFVVCDLDVDDVCWIKGNLCVAANFNCRLPVSTALAEQEQHYSCPTTAVPP